MSQTSRHLRSSRVRIDHGENCTTEHSQSSIVAVIEDDTQCGASSCSAPMESSRRVSMAITCVDEREELGAILVHKSERHWHATLDVPVTSATHPALLAPYYSAVESYHGARH